MADHAPTDKPQSDPEQGRPAGKGRDYPALFSGALRRFASWWAAWRDRPWRARPKEDVAWRSFGRSIDDDLMAMRRRLWETPPAKPLESFVFRRKNGDIVGRGPAFEEASRHVRALGLDVKLIEVRDLAEAFGDDVPRQP